MIEMIPVDGKGSGDGTYNPECQEPIDAAVVVVADGDMSLAEEAGHVRRRSLDYGDPAFGRNGEEVRVYKAELR